MVAGEGIGIEVTAKGQPVLEEANNEAAQQSAKVKEPANRYNYPLAI